MSLLDADIESCTALVVEGNPTARSIIKSQLRDFGLREVTQASRPTDARRALEIREFDIVICEQSFHGTNYTGQELLDDLRRAQLLPSSTVFIMLTSEASYAQVAEAAESALDCYLLKPHTATALGQRLSHARYRKKVLNSIFDRIETGDFAGAAQLCLDRFTRRQEFWLFAARIGAELLLRLERIAEAQQLFSAILEVQALPWAKLGIARAEMDAGHPNQALMTLEALVSDQPGYADAYDVMGRIHVEQGNFEQALEVYRQASNATPSSIGRLQKQGMLAFYMGEKEEAAKALDRATMLGLSSKMFDHQSLMLLAFARYQMRDTQGVKRCIDQLQTALEQKDHPVRLKRFLDVAKTLLLLLNKQVALVVAEVKRQTGDIKDPSMDVEAGCNLLSLIAEVAQAELDLDAAPKWVDAIALRFCTSKGLTGLLCSAAERHPPYAAIVRASNLQIAELAQKAMSHAIAGNPRAAVKAMVTYGGQTLNTKLMDTARLTLQRYRAKVPDAEGLDQMIQDQLKRYAPSSVPPPLGQPTGRSAGGLSLRTAAEKASEAAAHATPAH